MKQEIRQLCADRATDVVECLDVVRTQMLPEPLLLSWMGAEKVLLDERLHSVSLEEVDCGKPLAKMVRELPGR